MNTLEMLRSTDLFRGLDETQLAKIESAAEKRDYARGNTIFEEGSEGNEIYILTSGRVSVELNLYKDLTTEQIYQPKSGEVFGEMCLVGGHRRSAKTRAQDDVSAIVISREKLLGIMESDPAAGYRIMKNLASITAVKLRDTNIALRNILMQQKYIFGGIQ